ncbi:MAG: DUF3574 domain-containing protein [Acidiferrobacterales bacterium]|nr:DUF3574 domain-containing protein [Acidiferrobacterales bacterium]
MNMKIRSAIKSGVIGLFVFFMISSVSQPTSAHEVACPPGMSPWVTFNLYFGRGTPDNPEAVSEEDWNQFLRDVITPRFPGGLTVIDVYGQHYDHAVNRVISEKTKLLNVLAPYEVIETVANAVSAIEQEYVERFPERGGVFMTSIPVSCVGL